MRTVVKRTSETTNRRNDRRKKVNITTFLKRQTALGEPRIHVKRCDAVMSLEDTTFGNGKQHRGNQEFV